MVRGRRGGRGHGVVLLHGPGGLLQRRHLADLGRGRLCGRLATTAGKEKYQLRQQTVEPVFGIIKSVLGFRRFLLRGVEKVNLEWTLVCAAYNLKRLHRLGGFKRAVAG